VHDAPHTAHRFGGAGRSDSTDFFAISRISGEMIGSVVGFFFILVFTIEQVVLYRQPAFHRRCCTIRLHLYDAKPP
jgi:hypothetical protein